MNDQYNSFFFNTKLRLLNNTNEVAVIITLLIIIPKETACRFSLSPTTFRNTGFINT